MFKTVREGARVVSQGGTTGVVKRLKNWGRIAEVRTAFGTMTFKTNELIPA